MLLTGHGGNKFAILFFKEKSVIKPHVLALWKRRRHTPSILVICSPLEGFVRTTSSPSVVAKMLAPLSIAKEPPVNRGPITFPTSNVVFKGCFVAILISLLQRSCMKDEGLFVATIVGKSTIFPPKKLFIDKGLIDKLRHAPRPQSITPKPPTQLQPRHPPHLAHRFLRYQRLWI